MSKTIALLLALAGLFVGLGHAQATCTGGVNGTVQTQSFLLTQEFQDGQAAGSISPGCMRDLIATLGQGNVGIEIDFFMFGAPPNSALLTKQFSRTTIVPANAAIKCNAAAGATASTTITLIRVVPGVSSSNIGTVVFAALGAANEACTATFSSQVTFSPGDLLEASFPASADATASGINISIPALQ